ncbi:protein suppressor of white apricot isoform X2 [Contarinia nasturtii]|nr:protein suppressor of white apricot isoform X2 [Contarinia nasturtii]XP_031625741.1 protein suppressor of white apricot isoform X2 [Contarinia nasturtii]
MAYLSPMEQRAEQLCEEERYFSLYNNDFEEELYKEENQKRQQTGTGYGQVGFSYDQSSSSQQNSIEDASKADSENKEPDEVYVPHPRFYLPPDMEIPTTTKVQAIIEKTARFISEQGPQMEILIKAKQANNPLFDFLNQNGRLNAFYKHSLQAMKDGNYPTDTDQTENAYPSTPPETTGSMYQNYYSANQSMIQVPSIKYKPSADCAYTQLISKIKGVPISEATSAPEEKTTTVQQNSQQTENKPVAPTVEVKKISSGLMLAQYYNSDSENEEDNNDENNQVESNGKTVLNNNSSSKIFESNENALPPGIMVPPPELRLIIEKTALYVLKNGKDFEDILRAKNEQRFSFLQYKDPYHKFYTFKVTGAISPGPADVIRLGNEKRQEPKPLAPVSFSIKSKEYSTPATLKPALTLEHSSDEEPQQSPSNAQSSLSNEVVQTNLPPQVPKSQNGDDQTSNEVELTDSFIRDVILEQQNQDERKQAKRAEEKVKDRLAQLAREKLGILSKEKQLQLERKRRAMAFLNQINGDENPGSGKIEKKPDSATETKVSSTNSKTVDYASDSSDSVTFVMESSPAPSVSQTTQKARNRTTNSSESDDVIEINPKSRSRSRDRSRSKSKHSRHKSKRDKKSKRSRSSSRSRSRSRKSSRYSRSNSRDYKRKKKRSTSKGRKHRYYKD